MEKSPPDIALAVAFICLIGSTMLFEPIYAGIIIIAEATTMLITRAKNRLSSAAFSSFSGFTRKTAPITTPLLFITGSPIITPTLFSVLGEYTDSPESTVLRYVATTAILASSSPRLG